MINPELLYQLWKYESDERLSAASPAARTRGTSEPGGCTLAGR
jgi:hypothetical protein